MVAASKPQVEPSPHADVRADAENPARRGRPSSASDVVDAASLQKRQTVFVGNMMLRRQPLIGAPASKAENTPDAGTLAQSDDTFPVDKVRQGGFSAADVVNLAALFAPHGRHRKFIALEKWEGLVLDVKTDADIFVARLVDLLDNVELEKQAEIYLDEVPDEDRALIVPGAVFYWTIGYQTEPTGQRFTRSAIRFRRMPNVSDADVDEARRRVRDAGPIEGW